MFKILDAKSNVVATVATPREAFAACVGKLVRHVGVDGMVINHVNKMTAMQFINDLDALPEVAAAPVAAVPVPAVPVAAAPVAAVPVPAAPVPAVPVAAVPVADGPVFDFDKFAATLAGIDAAKIMQEFKNCRGVSGALSAYVKGGKTLHAKLGGFAHVWRGILETVCFGNKRNLLGFEVTSKRQSPAYLALQSLGVIDVNGVVLIAQIKDLGDVRTEYLTDLSIAKFCAWCVDAETAQRKIDAAAREEKKIEKENSGIESAKTEGPALPEVALPVKMSDAAIISTARDIIESGHVDIITLRELQALINAQIVASELKIEREEGREVARKFNEVIAARADYVSLNRDREVLLSKLTGLVDSDTPEKQAAIDQNMARITEVTTKLIALGETLPL